MLNNEAREAVAKCSRGAAQRPHSGATAASRRIPAHPGLIASSMLGKRVSWQCSEKPE